uniref:NADH dehydrogenase [ubiquinone] 1 subunit C2 n=1 Tax=Scolopendra viridis TaxID=118503 RepID=A0A4D5R9Y3_SCOVI
MDILLGKEPSAIRESVITRYFPAVTCGAVAIAGSFFVNLGTKRPLFSGIQKHIFAVAAGGYAGECLYHWRKRLAAERDAVIRHYIELHPEDFIEPPKLKYKDVLEEWIPIR